MNQRVYDKLEYHRIISMLRSLASTSTGKERVDQLQPMTSLYAIQLAQDETMEAKELWRLFPMFTLGGVYDLREYEKKAAMDGVIESREFLQIMDTLYASDRIRTFFQEEEPAFPVLQELAIGLHPLPGLVGDIRRTITDEGEVADRASQELYRLRMKLRSLQGRAKERLEGMIRNPEFAKYLQDPIISIRGDRYVLPVRADSRSQVPGIVHDQSGSGATLFIEPMQVVEINNETQQCEIEERAEVFRILRQLTQQVKGFIRELEEIRESLTCLDFALAKGKLSAQGDWVMPKLNAQGQLHFINARHPLIPGKAVPITVELGKDFDGIIVTGPNTGGKTVLLKTIGLLTLMAQAGLHLPVEDGTEVAIFHQVFIDIGDEQSIEQSLSTFSSHMTTIIDITNQAGAASLVLLDELGAGTDPREGAALAMAIIQDLLEKKAKLVATTHYSELKSFASSHERVENASVEFDAQTLRPTYRLMMGIPGRSNAFDISLRLGLHPGIIESAKAFQSQEEARTAKLIEELEINQLRMEKEKEEAAALRKEAADTLAWIQKKEEDTKARVERMLEKAREEALDVVSAARKESDGLLKELRDMQKAGYANYVEAEAQKARQTLRNQESKHRESLEEEARERRAALAPVELRPGDMVYLRKLNQKAQVLTASSSQGEISVQAGLMKLIVHIDDVEYLPEEDSITTGASRDKSKNNSGAGAIGAGKAKSISGEIDLRGKLVEEAITEVEKYLDDAYLSGLGQVCIIHGKGTGALRRAIRDLAAGHPFIAEARLGAQNEGGDGVTVVTMRVS